MLCRLLSLQLANHHHQGQHSSFDKNNHFMMLHEDNNSTFGVEKRIGWRQLEMENEINIPGW